MKTINTYSMNVRADATSPFELRKVRLDMGKRHEESALLILSSLISSIDQVSLCFLFKKIVCEGEKSASAGQSFKEKSPNLEDVVLDFFILVQLILESTAVEAHFQLSSVLWYLLDQVHSKDSSSNSRAPRK